MTRKTKERGDMILRETIRAPMQMCRKHRVLTHASGLGCMTINAVWRRSGDQPDAHVLNPGPGSFHPSEECKSQCRCLTFHISIHGYFRYCSHLLHYSTPNRSNNFGSTVLSVRQIQKDRTFRHALTLLIRAAYDPGWNVILQRYIRERSGGRNRQNRV